MPVKVDDNTDIQSAYDGRANPTQQDSQLSNMEERGSDAAYVSSGIDQLEAYANDPANHVRDIENNGAAAANWSVNRSNDGGGAAKQDTKGRFGKIAKSVGPTGGIVGGLIAAVFGISSLSSPALLLNHITAGFLDKWDTRTTTATLRTNKLIVKKLVGDSTSGSCNYVKMMCRYKKPSNSLLKKLEKQGIKAVNAAGESVKTGGLWPNERPDHFKFTRSNGVEIKVTAAELAPTLANDIEFRKAFHTAYNTRFQNFADSVYQKVLARFGASKADKLAGVIDDATAKEKLTAASEGEDIGAKAAKQEGADATEGIIKRLLGEELSEIFKKIGKAGKGDAVGLVAGGACLVADGPGIASKVVRAYQMAQLVKFAMVFLTVADKIKAGHATSAEVSALGSILTTTYKSSRGDVTNRAAVDSFGVKNGLFGDTDTSMETSGHSYRKFQPGGSIVASLSNITQYTDSKMKKDACDVATNPLTGFAINAALASTGAGVVIAGVNVAVGMVLGTAIEKLSEPLAESASALLKPVFQNILSGLLGDYTANIFGEDVGNALASGASHMLSQSANAGGNVPLSIGDAIAFKDTQNKVNLAYAAEDRVGQSPFDASNPSTFLGSIVNQFIPYASQMATISGVFSTISSITLGSFGNIISPSTHADASKEYSLCDDTSINSGSVAVGPFCNIVYGIPNTYTDTDPDVVLQYLIDKGYVDEDTGDPKADSELETWMGMCLDGKTDQAENCKIDGPGTDSESSKKFAYFALYTVDHQLQKDMDGEDEAVAEGSTAIDTPTTGTTPSGSCPAGTSVVQGITKGWVRGSGSETSITLCSIPNTNAQVIPGWKNSKYEGTSALGLTKIAINSEAAQSLLDAATKYKKETGHELSASVGYRSVYEQCSILKGNGNHVLASQKKYYKKYCSPNSSWLKYPGGNWSTGVVISNHMMGYSIDFSSASENWMRSCEKDATDGAKDGRCFGFYDDVYQSQGWDSAHFTFKAAANST